MMHELGEGEGKLDEEEFSYEDACDRGDWRAG
jgi:hypothetical protein